MISPYHHRRRRFYNATERLRQIVFGALAAIALFFLLWPLLVTIVMYWLDF